MFVGDQATTQSADSITGGSGSDLLKIAGFTGSSVAVAGSAAVRDVQTITPTIATTTTTQTLTVTAFGVTVVTAAMDNTATVAEVNTLVSGAINGIAGSTVATVVGGQVVVSAPVAGQALGTISVAVTTGDANVTFAQANPSVNAPAVAPIAAVAQSVLPTMTGIETLLLTGQATIGNYDFSAATLATTGINAIQFENVSLLNANSITVTAGQSVQLSTGATSGPTAGTITVNYAATATSANLILSGYQATGTERALTVAGAALTSMNVQSTGAQTRNEISTFTLPTTVTTMNVTGDKAFAINTNLISGAVATGLLAVNASGNTGGTTVTFGAVTNANFAYTGGTGNDVVIFADNGLGALVSGSQINLGSGAADKVGLFDTAISVAEYAALNAVVGLDRIGLNAAVTFDASQVTTAKFFSLDSNAAQIINNMATGSTVATPVAHAAAITTSGAVGVNDMTFIIGTATTTGLTLGGTVTFGQTAVALQSLGNGGAGANVITTFANAANSSITVTGNQGLTLTLASSTTLGSKVDASAATGVMTLTAGTGAYAANSARGDILIGGSAADILASGTNSGILTGNGGNDTFTVAAAVAGGTANANITTITDLTVGDRITFAATAEAFTATAVNLSSANSQQAAINLLLAGNNSDIRWGVYNGNTLIVDDVAAGATMAATDTVVQITGVLNLSNSIFSGNTLTIA